MDTNNDAVQHDDEQAVPPADPAPHWYHNALDYLAECGKYSERDLRESQMFLNAMSARKMSVIHKKQKQGIKTKTL